MSLTSSRVAESSGALPPQVGERLWTIVQLAEYLNCSVAAAKQKVHRRQIPTIRINRTLRFDPQVIRDFCAAQTSPVEVAK